MKRLVLAAVLALAAAAPAYAASCPRHMADIDRVIQTANVDAAKKQEAMNLRASGEAKHKAGQHAASVADLTKAKGLLGIK